MTMPGRMFLQKFLRQAKRAGCQYAVIEMTSEGVKQYRHAFIDIDMLIFTNITPEHLESHGSFEKYLAAKLELARTLEKSRKKNRTIIANADDPHGKQFLEARVEHTIPFSLRDAESYIVRERGISLTIDRTKIESPLLGLFNIYNILAAALCAKQLGV